jgi:hypothetical protein
MRIAGFEAQRDLAASTDFPLRGDRPLCSGAAHFASHLVRAGHIASTKNLTRGFAQLAMVKIFRWNIPRKLARVMVPDHFFLPPVLNSFRAG